MSLCTVPSCNRPQKGLGYCNAHYQRFKLTGDVQADKPLRRFAATEDDFWALVDRSAGPDACWPWLGSLDNAGYGLLPIPMRRLVPEKPVTKPHQLAYLLAIGPIDECMVFDHTCHTKTCDFGTTCPHRACCNFAHLEPVTRLENILRGRGPLSMPIASAVRAQQQRSQTHCKWGHPFDETNTFWYNGKRACRICRALRDVKYRKARQAQLPPNPHPRRTRSTNRLLTLHGETHCVTEWAELLELPTSVLFARVKYGWDDERILTTPIQVHRRSHPSSPPCA